MERPVASFDFAFGLALRLAQNNAVAERRGIELDGQTLACAVPKRRADLGPDSLFAFAFLDAMWA